MPTDTEFLTEARVRDLAREMIDASKKNKYIPTPEQMEQMLLELPDQTTRKYEMDVVQYALKWDDTVIKGALPDFIKLIDGENPSKEDRRLAFNAFCVAENYARRNENLSELKETMKLYQDKFRQEPFLIHLGVCSAIKELEAFHKSAWTPDRLKTVIETARLNMENLRGAINKPEEGNIGGAHAFAETVVLAFENASSLLDNLTGISKEDLLNEALDVMVETHIQDSKYAKFYCTHGRLFAVAGRYDDALAYLNKAIDREDSSKVDYPIRVGKYLAYVQQIRAQQQAENNKLAADEQLQNVVATIEEQTKDSTTKSMEFLGLFSGIVSFTIGSLTIGSAVAEQSIKHAAGLIIVLMGALVGVFAAFGIILHGVWGKKAIRNLFVLLLGLGIVLGGIWLCLQ